MNKKLLLISGGGHCKTVIEAIESKNHYNQIGIIDIENNIGKSILNHPIIGTDQELKKFREQGYTYAFISMGSLGDSTKRIALYRLVKELKFQVPIIIDQTAHVSHYAKISEGVFVGKNVIINADAVIGECVILNTGCIIEHDCRIGGFSHIAPGAVLSGNVTIGEGAHIGANSVIRQGICVGERTVIGVGSVVVKDIESDCVAVGNPCRKVEKH